MTLRSILYGSAAAAVLAVASPVLSPVNLNPVAPVQAAVSVSISAFYDDLAPYGDWVNYQGGYVFVPADTGPDWRPYTVGRWVYTDDYGWTWVSDEEYGWAVYHYGRWALSEDIGWYWVPGTRWAPAWVSWRRSDDYVVWAPLPPDEDDTDLAFNISIGTISDDYWVAVPTRSFLDINLSVSIVDDADDRRRIVREARDEDRVRVRNDRMMNVAFEPEFIEERTGKKVERREVRKSERRGRDKVDDNSIEVFNEDIRPERDAKPKKVKEANQVRRSGNAGEQTNMEGVTDPAKPNRKKAQKAVEGEPPLEDGITVGLPDNQDPAKPNRKKPRQAKQVEEQPVDDGVAVGLPDDQDPAKPNRKRPRQAKQVEEQPAVKERRQKIVIDEPQGGADEPVKSTKQQRRTKPAVQAAEQPETQVKKKPQAERKRQAEKPAQGKKEAPARKKAKACDPNVEQCPAQ